MRLSSALLIAIGAGTAVRGPTAGAPPDRTCRAESVLRADARTLATSHASDETVYRFAQGKLFLRHADRAEYEYGTLVETEAGGFRFAVGNKTVLFDSPDARAGLVVHSDQVEVRVLRLRCR